MKVELGKCFVMVRSIIYDAATLVNQSFCSTACGVTIIHVGFAVISFGQCAVIVIRIGGEVIEVISPDHHAQGFPGIEIPLAESVPRRTFVKLLSLAFAYVVLRQLVEFADVSCYGILAGVFSGFLDCVVNTFAVYRRIGDLA